jgi:hypothetical protein
MYAVSKFSLMLAWPKEKRDKNKIPPRAHKAHAYLRM